MDLLMDLAIDLPIKPPPVTEALIGWMFMVDCKPQYKLQSKLTTESQHHTYKSMQ